MLDLVPQKIEDRFIAQSVKACQVGPSECVFKDPVLDLDEAFREFYCLARDEGCYRIGYRLLH